MGILTTRGARRTSRGRIAVVASAAVLAAALAYPAVASATTFTFKPNQLVNGNAQSSGATVAFSYYPLFLFIGSSGTMNAFMTDADGWAMMPVNGGTATPAPYHTFNVAGGYGTAGWWAGGFDVRNTGASTVTITVTASPGGTQKVTTFDIEPGTEHVGLSGYSALGNWSNLAITFPITGALSFNNFDLGDYAAPAAPTVSTGAVSAIAASGATVAGTVGYDGGSTVTGRGICFSKSSATPTLLSGTVSAGTGAGAFYATLSGLDAGTTYYVRAYATNANGTSYGDVTSFSTAPPPPPNLTGVDASSWWSLSFMALAGLGGLALARKRARA